MRTASGKCSSGPAHQRTGSGRRLGQFLETVERPALFRASGKRMNYGEAAVGSWAIDTRERREPDSLPVKRSSRPHGWRNRPEESPGRNSKRRLVTAWRNSGRLAPYQEMIESKAAQFGDQLFGAARTPTCPGLWRRWSGCGRRSGRKLGSGKRPKPRHNRPLGTPSRAELE